MKGRLLFAAGLGLGFVLGARAGRGSYERIKSRAQDVWTDPKVQKGLHDAEEFVKDKAPIVGEKLRDATVSASGAVRDRISGDSSASDRLDDAQGHVADAAGSAKDAAGSAKDVASNAVDNAKHNASDIASTAEDTASDAAATAKDTASDVAATAKDEAAGVADSLDDRAGER
ncbi:hypothetical protein [Curtobacterium sp. RRHDQ10]|uniref:hypothetical protein n=1 Tax=Curtobacterium phyllosphaerae TaxID=3413379 RepID=UPI003BF0ED7F